MLLRERVEKLGMFCPCLFLSDTEKRRAKDESIVKPIELPSLGANIIPRPRESEGRNHVVCHRIHHGRIVTSGESSTDQRSLS